MKRYLNQLFLTLFLLLSGTILLVCFTGTFHQIPIIWILLISCIWLAAFCFLFFLLNRWKNKLAVIRDRWILLFLSIWGGILFLFGLYIKGKPTSDYWYIHAFFTDWLNNVTPDWSYFARWENNLPLFYLFAPAVKLGSLLGITDLQCSLGILNIMMLVGTGYALYLLIQQGLPDQKDNVVVRYMALLLYIGFVPVWGSVFYAYSDSASMFFAITSMACYVSKEIPKKISCIAGGVFAGIAYLLKPTSFFVILGLWLVQLVLYSFRRHWKSVLLSLCSVLCVIALFRYSAQFMPHQAYLSTHKMPWQYWICLGMTKDGTYVENLYSLAVPFFEMDSYAERKEYGMQYISEHVGNFFDKKRILDKTKVNFANGLFGLDEYVTAKTWSVFASDGTYNVLVTAVFSPYYYVMVLLLWCSALYMLSYKSDQPGFELLKAVMADLIGLILFLFFWETNNRQLYNQMPWFALSASLGISVLSDVIFP